LLCIPLFHIGIGPLTHVSQLKDGRTAYIMRRFDVERFLKLHASFQITECLLVPPIINAIVMSGLADPTDRRYRVDCSLWSPRHGLAGAAPLGAAMQKRFHSLMAPGASFGQLWGYDGNHRHRHTCEAWYQERRGRLFRLCGQAGAELGAENCGEGYIKSGDIGYVDSKTGLWYIVDRRKERIKVRGFQVAPPEIEGVLLSHPGIADAAVIGVRTMVAGGPAGYEWDERPRAYVVKKAGGAGVQQQ
jgi:4-coumarate--CoA ligase